MPLGFDLRLLHAYWERDALRQTHKHRRQTWYWSSSQDSINQNVSH